LVRSDVCKSHLVNWGRVFVILLQTALDMRDKSGHFEVRTVYLNTLIRSKLNSETLGMAGPQIPILSEYTTMGTRSSKRSRLKRRMLRYLLLLVYGTVTVPVTDWGIDRPRKRPQKLAVEALDEVDHGGRLADLPRGQDEVPGERVVSKRGTHRSRRVKAWRDVLYRRVEDVWNGAVWVPDSSTFDAVYGQRVVPEVERGSGEKPVSGRQMRRRGWWREQKGRVSNVVLTYHKKRKQGRFLCKLTINKIYSSPYEEDLPQSFWEEQTAKCRRREHTFVLSTKLNPWERLLFDPSDPHPFFGFRILDSRAPFLVKEEAVNVPFEWVADHLVDFYT